MQVTLNTQQDDQHFIIAIVVVIIVCLFAVFCNHCDLNIELVT